MVAFPLNADITPSPDFDIARDGGVARFADPDALAATEGQLTEIGYEVVSLECSTWDEATLHRVLANALAFPDYYGRNLNALHDCLYDVAHGDYGWDPRRTGLAITLRGYGRFCCSEPELAHGLANTAARCSRTALLFGHRIIWLLLDDNADNTLGVHNRS